MSSVRRDGGCVGLGWVLPGVLGLSLFGAQAQSAGPQVVNSTFQVLIHTTAPGTVNARCAARVRTGSSVPAVQLACLALPPGALGAAGEAARSGRTPSPGSDAATWLVAGPPGAGLDTEAVDMRPGPRPDGGAGSQLVIWF